MTDILINGHGKPLSMSPAAIRQRNKRARDRCVTTVTRPAPPGQRDPSRRQAGTVLRFNGSHARDSQGDTVTPVQNHKLNGVTPLRASGVTPHLSPSIVPGDGTLSPPSRARVTLSTVTFSTIGVTLLAASLGTNSTYVMSQGTSAWNMAILALVAISYELVTVAFPSGIARKYREGEYLTVAFGCFALVAGWVMVSLAAAGFANANIGDTVAGRARVASTAATLTADIARNRRDRDAITVIPTSKVQVDTARDAVDSGCARETSECKLRRAKLADLSRLRADVERAEYLDKEILRLQGELKLAPAVGTADPQADGAVRYVAQMSRGSVAMSSNDVDVIRIWSLALLAPLAGISFMFARPGSSRDRKRVVTDDGFRNRSPGVDSNLTAQPA